MLSGLLSQRWYGRRPSAKSLDDDRLEGIDLFEAIVGELHSTALQIAAITSAVNAFRPGASSRLVRSLVNFIPHTPPLVAGMRQCKEELNLPQEAARYVDLLFGELEKARKIADLFVADVDRYGPPQALERHTATLVTSWRALSEVALDAVDAMEPQTRWRLTGLYSENSLVLARLLRGVIHGQQPCLDPRGDIILPDLPQRRRARRHAILQNCALHSRGVRHDAFANDISATGLGLTNAPALMLKQPVDVELKGGRHLSGTVVWVKDGKVGVQFVTALPLNDPLLAS